ncbi:leucyl-tRNA synthetase [Pancytospora philotis]|nr:leucyl-tRNA synthetase [Pancytospora philotis]
MSEQAKPTASENGGGKLAYLNSVERHEAVFTDVDHSKEKFFATFPYPYMNGKLHLGHLYSFSKVDFTAYYKRLCGYNVLLPFAFHCTGMPISASAYKLKEELAGRPVDVSVAGILHGLGFEDLVPFTDPVHWIRTFPKYGRSTLEAYHASVDWRRSFITTDINPYYDSFVRYQFKRLRAAGCIAFGKRYSIFCTIDQQPCLDHDRRKGEGVKPAEVLLYKVPLGSHVLLVRCPSPQAVKKVTVSSTRGLACFRVGAQTYLVESALAENLRYQVDGLELLSDMIPSEELLLANIERLSVTAGAVSPNVVFTTNDIAPKATFSDEKSENAEYEELLARSNEELVLVESASYVKMYEPESLVISRSGSHCVVSLLDQWFLDYGNAEWKQKVRACVDAMTLTADTRAKLEESIGWINKWGCSRSFGLGSRLPWDEQYLIESLSDSTIYMAFYTVKHFLFSDLEGKDEIFPAAQLSDAVWDFILTDKTFEEAFGKTDMQKEHVRILEKCKESFAYFYPVDLRVSGKDLIGNHLTFFIFNHVALFDKPFWPRRIFTNGHALLNSAKMSKSDGNFLSVEDALERYGASATRMCLALCGDTNEDANFEESTVNALVLKLYTLCKTVEKLDCCSSEELAAAVAAATSSDSSFADGFFVQSLSRNIEAAVAAYEAMTFRDTVKYAFYESLHLFEQYAAVGGASKALVAFGYKTMLQLIYPIVPSLVKYLIDTKFDGDLSLPSPVIAANDKAEAVAYVRSLCGKINAQKRDRTHLRIGVSSAYPAWKIECMKVVDELRAGHTGEPDKAQKQAIIAAVTPVMAQSGVPVKKGLVFVMDYLKDPKAYAKSFSELEVLATMRDYVRDLTGVDAAVTSCDRAEPLRPSLTFE